MTTKKKIKRNKKTANYKLATRNTDETLRFLEKIGGRLTLGEAIRAIRECDEIKQNDFAKKLGVTQSYLCDLENNRKEVSPKKAAEFARILEHPEKLFILLALRDMFNRQGLRYEIEVHEAA